jgi:hypothetical protein
VSYKVVLSKQSIKDIAKLKTINLSEKAKMILENMEN